ncbi:ion transporter [Spiribacter halobius]|uniref:Voltage-gated sodium channel n=1 Tax=Sediminicurvatus halobius TaxID=2182432 RepID=A0A2U2N582_9GAMM|nr:ion transporter [Spiribacter halobius]PWG64326.1 voltage-gated sodium channel [Spiribacter halobius]UEX79330.1 ion transporter [Spiribacter halobius]
MASLAAARERAGIWIESPGPHGFIIGLIVLNAITLGLETSATVTRLAGVWLDAIEAAVLAVFVVEILIKLFAWGPRFFRNGWNVFDLAIVGVALAPASGPLSILRSLRILRVLRLLSTVRRLRQLVEALITAIPSIGWIAFLLGLVFYIFGVMGTELFGPTFPEWFGTLGASMYTLFQVMTLESWSMGIARPVMETHPFAWLYFVSFILVTAFTILNLFIGIIVNTMQSAHWEEQDERRAETEARAHREREEILSLVRRISARLDRLEAESTGADGATR